MNERIRGRRPRPRVALLGVFCPEEKEYYKRLFPTIWSSPNIHNLQAQVNIKEIDLLVIARDIKLADNWPDFVHVICFSKEITSLPGPFQNSIIYLNQQAKTEAFLLPDLPLSLNHQREADLIHLESVREWCEIELKDVRHASGHHLFEGAQERFKATSLISNAHNRAPLAVQFSRMHNNLGVAWLPEPVFNRTAWVTSLTTQWAQADRERFPQFGDWTMAPEWMVPDEEALWERIAALEAQKREIISRTDAEIACLENNLAETAIRANQGRRRLVTAQADELVEEVAAVFQEWGFNVQRMDSVLKPGMPKREDLRLTDPDDASPAWEAILEVRGYARSAGSSADLQRLARFTSLYQMEKGRLPNKRLYIVNGQLELPPSQRQQPLASAREDVEVFSEDDGIVISTLDLFRAAKAFTLKDFTMIRQSIKSSRGRWTIDSVQKLAEEKEGMD